MKKRKWFLLLLLLAVLCVGGFWLYREKTPSVRFDYSISLPEGYILQTDPRTGNAQILRQGLVVGGILSCPYPEKPPYVIHGGNSGAFFDYIRAALAAADAPGADQSSFPNSMMGSTANTDCSVWFGNREQEFRHYLHLFKEGVLTLWFDLSLVSEDTARSIAASFDTAKPVPKQSA